MPKMTAKYVAAISSLHKLKLSTDGDQLATYQRLQEAGFMWDSKTQIWLRLADQPANSPTPLVRVRVWTRKGKSAEIAATVVDALKKRYCLLEQSDAFPCRPPKQLEERIYLSFMKLDKER